MIIRLHNFILKEVLERNIDNYFIFDLNIDTLLSLREEFREHYAQLHSEISVDLDISTAFVLGDFITGDFILEKIILDYEDNVRVFIKQPGKMLFFKFYLFDFVKYCVIEDDRLFYDLNSLTRIKNKLDDLADRVDDYKVDVTKYFCNKINFTKVELTKNIVVFTLKDKSLEIPISRIFEGNNQNVTN